MLLMQLYSARPNLQGRIRANPQIHICRADREDSTLNSLPKYWLWAAYLFKLEIRDNKVTCFCIFFSIQLQKCFITCALFGYIVSTVHVKKNNNLNKKLVRLLSENESKELEYYLMTISVCQVKCFGWWTRTKSVCELQHWQSAHPSMPRELKPTHTHTHKNPRCSQREIWRWEQRRAP